MKHQKKGIIEIDFLAYMHFEILTLFPEFFETPLQSSILKKALEKKIFSFSTKNIRDFADNKHCKVDDTPYGGGAGMLLKPDVVGKCIDDAKKKFPRSEVIFFAPTGKPFTQKNAEEKAKNGKAKIVLCGHYEGVDQRVLDAKVDEIFSIGNAVLTGGEIPALFFVDSVVRLLPSAIGKKISHEEETFSEKFFGKGEYPQFTKPEIWQGKEVPSVLLSGNHAKMEEWKMENLQNLSEMEKKVLMLRTKIFSAEKPQKFRLKMDGKNREFCLRIPLKEDALAKIEAFQNPDITQYLSFDGSYEKLETEFFNWQHHNLHLLILTIVDRKTKKPLGNVSIELSEKFCGAGELGLVIWEKNEWGKGLATAVVNEILKISKEYLGLRKVELKVFAENVAAQKVYEKCGFRKVGFLEKHFCKNGVLVDEFLYEKIL